MSMKSAFSSFVKDLKADIKKELKIGDEKSLKEADSGVVETTESENQDNEQLADYSDDENETTTTEEKTQEKSETEDIKVDEEKTSQESTELESVETETQNDNTIDNMVEEDSKAVEEETTIELDHQAKNQDKPERPSIKRQKSALQSFIDDAEQKSKQKSEPKKKPNHQERTYIVESGRPASNTKSSTARSTNSGQIPMAEMIYRDQTRLPDRFRYKPVDVVQVALTRTVPVSPMLHTYARKGKSRRELEGERIRAERIRREEESYKRPQFVARKYCFD